VAEEADGLLHSVSRRGSARDARQAVVRIDLYQLPTRNGNKQPSFLSYSRIVARAKLKKQNALSVQQPLFSYLVVQLTGVQLYVLPDPAAEGQDMASGSRSLNLSLLSADKES